MNIALSSYRRVSARYLLVPLTALHICLGLAPARPQSKESTTAQSATPSQPAQPDKKEKKSSEPASFKLRIEVTGADGKPVGNASVYVRFNEPGGLFHKEKLAEMNFKTNEDGSVKVNDVPQGKVLIQVVAKGWHTFGKWYDIESDAQTLQIKLEPPPHWY